MTTEAQPSAQAAPIKLFELYVFSCAACGKILAGKPSYPMHHGINTANGYCPGCGAFLHIQIAPDLQGCIMVSEPYSAYLARTYPERAES